MNVLKPLTQRLSEGLGFGSVVGVGVSLPEVETYNSSGKIKVREVQSGNPDPSKSSNIVARLLHIEVGDQELKDQRQRLVAELMPLLEEAEQMEELLLEQRQEYLEALLKETRTKCRVQLKVCEQLQQNLKDAELALHRVAVKQEEASTALQNMRNVEQRGQHVPPYATAEELEGWKQIYRLAQSRVTKANERAAEALAERNRAMLAIEPANNEMHRLATEEARLRSEVTKQPFIDLDLGLSSGPVGYVRAD